MNLYLSGYSQGDRMVVVARDEEVYKKLLKRNVEIMRIYSDRIVFYPDNAVYSFNPNSNMKLDLLMDYDIVEISDTGVLYRAYSNNESDTTVFLGAKCNSNCIMCPASDSERRKGFSYSREVLLKYIDYLPAELDYLVITGGEPTMQPHLFIEALSRIKAKYAQTQVLLLTNGRSLSNEWLFEQVVNNKPNHFRIAVPIHGSNRLEHDYITRAPGSFDQTMLALSRLMKSDIDVEIRIVVTKVNCDYLLDIAKLISDHFDRVFCVNIVGLEPRGNCALNFEKVYIDHKKSFQKSKNAIDYLIQHGYDVGLYNYPLCSIDRDYWAIAEKSISGYKNVYHPDCSKCEVKSICGGFFTVALRIAKPQVYPYCSKEKNDE